jgi:hypothetical protein
MYEKCIDKIVDLVLNYSDNELYIREGVNEILVKIFEKDGAKSVYILNTIIVEYLNSQNYSQEIIYKILKIVDSVKK